MNRRRGNKKLRFFLVSILLVVLVGGLTLSGLAAEEQQGTGNFKKIWMNTWRVLNFLILAFFLVKFLKEPIRRFFQESIRGIRDKLQGTEEAYLGAEQELEATEKRLESLGEEIQKLEHTIGELGKRERDKIIANARQTAEQMMEKAKLEAAYSVEQAKSQLQREVLDEAVMIAEQSIRKAIDKQDQKRLVDEYLQDLKQIST